MVDRAIPVTICNCTSSFHNYDGVWHIIPLQYIHSVMEIIKTKDVFYNRIFVSTCCMRDIDGSYGHCGAVWDGRNYIKRPTSFFRGGDGAEAYIWGFGPLGPGEKYGSGSQGKRYSGGSLKRHGISAKGVGLPHWEYVRGLIGQGSWNFLSNIEVG